MEKFEYKILNISPTKINKEVFQMELMNTLNNLGGEGWELIDTEGLNSGSLFWRMTETTDILFIFKRKVST